MCKGLLNKERQTCLEFPEQTINKERKSSCPHEVERVMVRAETKVVPKLDVACSPCVCGCPHRRKHIALTGKQLRVVVGLKADIDSKWIEMGGHVHDAKEHSPTSG